jgi:ectoine hydroxylase-related dioxygenase (phytanoyl-CoA dioxygenase family)
LSGAVSIEADPGDLVLFSNALFHSAFPNQSDKIRWSVDWRYQDASKPTHRPQQGHIARSFKDIDLEVQSAEEWTTLSLT